MAVTEQCGARWNALLVDDRAPPRVGGFAGSEQLVLTEEAAAASDHKGNHHAVADLEISDCIPGVLDDAHELMAEDIARFGFWNFASVEVQVGAANGCGGDPEDNVVFLLDDWIRDVIDSDVVCAVVGECSHESQLLRPRISVIGMQVKP